MSDQSSAPAGQRKLPATGKSPRLALIIRLIAGGLFGAVDIIQGKAETAEPGDMELVVRAGGVVGEATASTFLVGVITWAIVYFAAVKPSGRPVGGAYFAIIIVVFLLIFAPLSFLHQFGLLDRGDPQIAALAKSYNATQAQDIRNYQDEMSVTINAQPLDPYLMEAPGGLAKAAEALKTQRAIVTKYRALAAQREADQRAKLEALKIDAGAKAAALAQFNSAMAKTDADLNTLWRLQFDALDHEEAMVAYLTRWRGSWRALGAGVSFNNANLIAGYKAITTPIQADQAQMKALVDRDRAQSAKTTPAG